jgi:hypothetical protein
LFSRFRRRGVRWKKRSVFWKKRSAGLEEEECGTGRRGVRDWKKRSAGLEEEECGTKLETEPEPLLPETPWIRWKKKIYPLNAFSVLYINCFINRIVNKFVLFSIFRPQ